MTKRLLTVLALCLCLCSYADEGLKRFSVKAATMVTSFTYDYVAVPSSGYKMSGSGTAVVKGNRFLVDGGGLRIFCDGQSRWVVDDAAMEVVIEAMDGSGADYALNPALLVGALGSEAGSVSTGSSVFKGRSCKLASLTPPQGSGLTSLKLYFNGENLIGAEVVSEDGTRTEFSIGSVTFSSEEPSFSFDVSSLGPDWVVTDLR